MSMYANLYMASLFNVALNIKKHLEPAIKKWFYKQTFASLQNRVNICHLVSQLL